MIALEDDNRPLTRPIAVRRAGAETSIRTIGSAIRFLDSDLKHWKTTSEWILAHEALCAAHDDYTDGHRDLATDQLELICTKYAR
jgi:hypothetical protein